MARSRMVVWVPSPPSTSDPPRRDRPTRQISDFPPNSPDHALRFTAIRASERFRGRVAPPAPSGPLPRPAITNASARNARHDAPRGPIRPRRQSTKRPASTSRRALNSPSETSSRLRWRSGRADGVKGGCFANGEQGADRNGGERGDAWGVILEATFDWSMRLCRPTEC
jgi:hypothetical protein